MRHMIGSIHLAVSGALKDRERCAAMILFYTSILFKNIKLLSILWKHQIIIPSGMEAFTNHQSYINY
jgi:hypothetical protein